MSLVETIFRGFEHFVLAYFSLHAVLYALSGYLGMRSVIVYSRELSQIPLKDLLERDFYKPISILVPCYNEERGIVANVRSMLDLQHPQFEIVVANDGSTDHTLEVMTEAFALVEAPHVYSRQVDTELVLRVFRSLRHPNLFVVDKENGRQADAVNAALNLARYPLVCRVDADSLLDAEAVLRASRLFIEDDTVVGVGGTLRPLNGAVIRDGHVVDLRAPDRWVERFQVLEYARAFFTSRAAWSQVACLPNISGAFGLFRRDAVLAVGGWWPETFADDVDIVMKLHRHFRDRGEPYRMVFLPDPICWTEVPSTFRGLSRQRNRWARGLWEVLWHHKGMLFRPRYGRMGLVGLPYQWFLEGLAPILEGLGYLYILAAALLGLLNVQFAILFFLLAVVYGVLLSQLAMGIETLLLSRYTRFRDRLVLFVAALLEYVVYHQVLVYVRFVGTFQVRSRRGTWWETERRGIPASDREGEATSAR